MHDDLTPHPPLAIWHGYLLGATGSNIYTHHLVESWVRSGRDVVLVCQEPDPSRHPSVQDAVWLETDRATGATRVRERVQVREHDESRGEGRCTMVVPDLHGVLPVYVLDRYEGFEVVRVPGLDAEVLDAYLADHAAALEWVLGEWPALAGVLVNHASPLPAALEPVLTQAGIPFAVKVHGSELEYALAEDESLIEPAARALRAAASVLVGSTHIERRTRELLGGDALGDGRVATVPPGVDLDRFRPVEQDDADRIDEHGRLVDALRERCEEQAGGRGPAQRERVEALVADAASGELDVAALIDELAALQHTYEARHVECTAADRVEAIDPTNARLLVYVGKLIPQKGVHLLLATLPLLLERHDDLHLVVAGFGPLRDGLEAMLQAMVRRDTAALDELVARMGELSGEGGRELTHLQRFLAQLRADGQLDAWLDAAARHRVDEHVTWLGLVDHEVLAHLWPLAEASVVPSVLAEAFGMVAAEAAACGCVPVVSDHSGLADAARVIEANGVAPIRFAADDEERAVDDLARVLLSRLDLEPVERARQARAARENVAAAWSWDALAAQVAGLCT